MARSRGLGMGKPQAPPLRRARSGMFSNCSPWKYCPPLCHLDRSAAKWRDLRFSGPFLEMFFLWSEIVKGSAVPSTLS
jgi:hypothetical protein